MHMKRRLLIVLIIVLVGAAIGIYFVLNKPKSEDEPIEADTPSVVEAVPTEVEAIPEKVYKTSRPLPPPRENDNDRDGVPDDQEEALGMSTKTSDTDGDGLTDKIELEKWKTDPTKADTDGDGFSDLKEIANGYNPSGEGLLNQ